MSKDTANPPTDPKALARAADGGVARESHASARSAVSSLVSGVGSGTLDASWDVTDLASHDLSEENLTTPGPDRKLLNGRFLIEKQLPSGGMSVLYLAHDIQDDRPVVLKHLNARFAAKESYIQKELEALQKLSHEGVIKVWDIRRLRMMDDETPLCLIMEYAEGPTLKACLPTQQVHQTGNVVWMKEVMTRLLAATAHIHERGIVHRDLKPENVIVTTPSKVRLIDFGLAADVAEVRSRERGCGTYFYTAPEVLGGQESTRQADVYSLGMILYELLTGIRTTGNLTRPSVWWREEEKGPRPFPKALDDVVMRAMAAQPAKRYADAQEMADAFAIAFAEGPWETRQAPVYIPELPKPAPRAQSPLQRYKAAWVGLVVLLVLLGGLVQQHSATPPPPRRGVTPGALRPVLPAPPNGRGRGVLGDADAGSRDGTGAVASADVPPVRRAVRRAPATPRGTCRGYWLRFGAFAKGQTEGMLIRQSQLYDANLFARVRHASTLVEGKPGIRWLVLGPWPTKERASTELRKSLALLKEKKLEPAPEHSIVSQTRWKTPWPACKMFAANVAQTP